jgi:chloride channel 7
MYMWINALLVMASVIVIFFVGELASGSGIPEVKGYLNGVRVSLSLPLIFSLSRILIL